MGEREELFKLEQQLKVAEEEYLAKKKQYDDKYLEVNGRNRYPEILFTVTQSCIDAQISMTHVYDVHLGYYPTFQEAKAAMATLDSQYRVKIKVKEIKYLGTWEISDRYRKQKLVRCK